MDSGVCDRARTSKVSSSPPAGTSQEPGHLPSARLAERWSSSAIQRKSCECHGRPGCCCKDHHEQRHHGRDEGSYNRANGALTLFLARHISLGHATEESVSMNAAQLSAATAATAATEEEAEHAPLKRTRGRPRKRPPSPVVRAEAQQVRGGQVTDERQDDQVRLVIAASQVCTRPRVRLMSVSHRLQPRDQLRLRLLPKQAHCPLSVPLCVNDAHCSAAWRLL